MLIPAVDFLARAVEVAEVDGRLTGNLLSEVSVATRAACSMLLILTLSYNRPPNHLCTWAMSLTLTAMNNTSTEPFESCEEQGRCQISASLLTCKGEHPIIWYFLESPLM